VDDNITLKRITIGSFIRTVESAVRTQQQQSIRHSRRLKTQIQHLFELLITFTQPVHWLVILHRNTIQ